LAAVGPSPACTIADGAHLGVERTRGTHLSYS
jgi:hypothetical protein